MHFVCHYMHLNFEKGRLFSCPGSIFVFIWLKQQTWIENLGYSIPVKLSWNNLKKKPFSGLGEDIENLHVNRETVNSVVWANLIYKWQKSDAITWIYKGFESNTNLCVSSLGHWPCCQWKDLISGVCMPYMQSLSLTVQKLKVRLKFFHRHKPNSRHLWIPFWEHEIKRHLITVQHLFFAWPYFREATTLDRFARLYIPVLS